MRSRTVQAEVTVTAVIAGALTVIVATGGRPIVIVIMIVIVIVIVDVALVAMMTAIVLAVMTAIVTDAGADRHLVIVTGPWCFVQCFWGFVTLHLYLTLDVCFVVLLADVGTVTVVIAAAVGPTPVPAAPAAPAAVAKMRSGHVALCCVVCCCET